MYYSDLIAALSDYRAGAARSGYILRLQKSVSFVYLAGLAYKWVMGSAST